MTAPIGRHLHQPRGGHCCRRSLVARVPGLEEGPYPDVTRHYLVPTVTPSSLFCIMIEDLPAVRARIKGLMRENELLRARVAELEAANEVGQQDAASLALQQANAYANRH